MKRPYGPILAAGVAMLALTAVSLGSDGHRTVKAKLKGFNEVPAISTTGRGKFRARLNADSIEWELDYERMEDTVVAAHIHIGQRDVNGGVMVFFCGGGGRPACTSPAGSFSGIITAAEVIGPAGQGIAAGDFDEVLRAIRAGVTYVNVHSTPRFPGGEIRGQVRDEDRD
ncbi:MAG: CHRD domain-containing protein [Steroidobacteraceae bacterium]